MNLRLIAGIQDMGLRKDVLRPLGMLVLSMTAINLYPSCLSSVLPTSTSGERKGKMIDAFFYFLHRNQVQPQTPLSPTSSNPSGKKNSDNQHYPLITISRTGNCFLSFRSVTYVQRVVVVMEI